MKTTRPRDRTRARNSPRSKATRTRSPRTARKTTRPTPAVPPSGNPMTDQVERAIAAALSKLGAPYVWATAGPDSFDCSGFIWWIASQVLGPQDYELRSSHHQFNVWGEGVWGEPIGGDLVFFDVGQGTIMGNLAGHVGLMLSAEQM